MRIPVLLLLLLLLLLTPTPSHPPPPPSPSLPPPLPPLQAITLDGEYADGYFNLGEAYSAVHQHDQVPRESPAPSKRALL